MTVGNQDVKKKSFIHKIFTMKEREGSGSSDFPEPQSNPAVDIQSISSTEPQMPAGQYVQSFRVFVATWNVGGKSPHNGLNLDDFLHVNNESDIYVLGFQEIVPLNAGNVLVLEDNEPAAKWLTLINQSLNKSLDGSSRSKASGSRFSSKPSLKKLKIEREAERVFKGWKEGKIYFAPTYKYFYNSDTYFGEIKTSKKKRRTPAWCDRILWHGSGIKQLSYIRGESQFSDHRPVCGTFVVDVVVNQNELKKGSPSSNMKIEIEELLPTARYLKNM
ncbi:PREDICTED: type [Prunus dulcis]|uniref:PREDICTED: type n=1 Tax=Prunus dulcis TaxID=3755 RepID=A0A5E4FIT5_PRUDU|nr:PREDICTED: type [Prunus dulcis]